VQFLGISPSAAVAIFAEVFHHQTHILQVANARFRVSEPKALRMAAHQGRRTLA